MQSDRIVANYSQAIYNLAEKGESVRETLDNLNKLLFIYSSSSDFRLFLNSRRIDLNSKKKIISTIFNGVLSTLEIDFLNEIIDNDKIDLLKSIIANFSNICDNYSNTIKVTITSATKLEIDQKNELLDLLEKKVDKKVELTEQLDPRILGGAKFRIGNQIIDGTIASRLSKLKKSFYEK